jgi:hypothetical protein
MRHIRAVDVDVDVEVEAVAPPPQLHVEPWKVHGLESD